MEGLFWPGGVQEVVRNLLFLTSVKQNNILNPVISWMLFPGSSIFFCKKIEKAFFFSEIWKATWEKSRWQSVLIWNSLAGLSIPDSYRSKGKRLGCSPGNSQNPFFGKQKKLQESPRPQSDKATNAGSLQVTKTWIPFSAFWKLIQKFAKRPHDWFNLHCQNRRGLLFHPW